MVVLDGGDDAPKQATASVSLPSVVGGACCAAVWLLGARDELEEEEQVLLHAHLSGGNSSSRGSSSRVAVFTKFLTRNIWPNRYCSTRT